MKNEAAFPVTENDTSGNTMREHYGLTKREYFAALCLQGLMVQAIPGGHNMDSPQCNMERAMHAVNQADALIAALGEG